MRGARLFPWVSGAFGGRGVFGEEFEEENLVFAVFGVGAGVDAVFNDGVTEGSAFEHVAHIGDRIAEEVEGGEMADFVD